MITSYNKMISIVVLVCVSFMLCGVNDLLAAGANVKIVINPNTTTIEAGSDAVALTAQASGENLQYTWNLVGPGSIDNTDLPAVFYTPPQSITGQSAQAIITVTVTVTDASGQKVTESATFKILSAEQEEAASAPASSKQGMSRTTKIAIGAGVVAAAGGVTALALSGGDDDDDEGPFSGNFKYEYVDQVNDGTTVYGQVLLELRQSDTTITGNRIVTSQFHCCTAGFTVPLTGSANGNTAVLTWGPGEGKCRCSDGSSYRTWHDGGTFTYTLINNGSILRSEYGGEYVHMKVNGQSVTHSEFGDYIRQ